VRQSTGAADRAAASTGVTHDATRPFLRGVLTSSSRFADRSVARMPSWTRFHTEDAGQSIDQAHPAGDGVHSVSAIGPSIA